MNVVSEQSTVRIFVVSKEKYPELFTASSALQDSILKMPKSVKKVREGDMQLGKMYVFGDHIHNAQRMCTYGATRYVAKNGVVGEYMKQYRKMIDMELPFDSAAMKATLDSIGVVPSVNMGGEDGVTHSLNASVDLMNPSHFDSNDFGIGVGTWFEQKPGDAEDWYFHLPNLVVVYKGVTYAGIVVQLCHGATITWDGTKIRHCSSLGRKDSNNHLFGFHTAHRSQTVDFFQRHNNIVDN